MAIVDVVVIPVGTEGPSVSKYIAEIQSKLKEYKALNIFNQYQAGCRHTAT